MSRLGPGTPGWAPVEEARQAALLVLRYNAQGPFGGLPRTAGWGYPEPYTRDLMLSILGVAVSGDADLLAVFRRVLETLAHNQSPRGHIPSLVHDPENRGASDTTPLFLLGTGVYRTMTEDPAFLGAAVDKALVWMEYQSPSDQFLVAQLPTSDWRDEQWVTGYGLYVNALLYSALGLLGCGERARGLRRDARLLALKDRPYLAFWSYKNERNRRFDLLGNALAILSGLVTLAQAQRIVAWVEQECSALMDAGELTPGLPPNFFPFIRPGDEEWRPRYALFNPPGDYHNGGIWPFIGGFYVAALVAAHRYSLAEERLAALTVLNRKSVSNHEFGFNEWAKAQDGQPRGQEWQTWSAALYLYAVKCVEKRSTPFFDQIRQTVGKI